MYVQTDLHSSQNQPHGASACRSCTKGLTDPAPVFLNWGWGVRADFSAEKYSVPFYGTCFASVDLTGNTRSAILL